MDKKPMPQEVTAEMENHCTCDEYEWDEHQCPYAEEIHGDHESTCTCCPYCIQQCCNDI